MKFYIACIQKLKELVEATALNTKEVFAACSSLRVFEASDFEFLSGIVLTPEQFLNSEDISSQLNSLSADDIFWDVDAQSNLYEYYKAYLEQLTLKGENAIEIAEALDQEILYNNNQPTQKLKAYNSFLDDFEMQIETLNAVYANADADANDDEKKALYLQADVCQKRIALLLAEWRLKGFKNEVENTLKRINKLSEYDQILELKNKALSDIKTIETTGIQSASTFIKLQMIPYNFYKNENAWSSLEVNQSELETILKRAQKSLKGFNNHVLTLNYDENFISKITLSYCIITIKRPWLYKDLLSSEHVLSNAKKTTYRYAKKIILMKDLRVIFKEDLSDKDKSQIQSHSIMKFGPIFMKNQFFVNKQSKEAFIKPVTNKKIYTSNYAIKLDKNLKKISPNVMMAKSNLQAGQKRVVDRKPSKAKIQKRQVVQFEKNLDAKAVAKVAAITKLNAKANLIFKIPNFNINLQKQSNIHINLTDKLSGEGIYKAELSFKSVNTNFFKEAETDENGRLTLTLPKGNYSIGIRKNGYKQIEFVQTVQENKNITINKSMEPQEVIFDSYFLMGVIADDISF